MLINGILIFSFQLPGTEMPQQLNWIATASELNCGFGPSRKNYRQLLEKEELEFLQFILVYMWSTSLSITKSFKAFISAICLFWNNLNLITNTYFSEVSIHFEYVYLPVHKCEYVNIVKYSMCIEQRTNIVCYQMDAIPSSAMPLKIISL